jgi:20S proteasome alpha/beta subunit
MTLILAIPATDGLVITSDSQITTGEVRTPGQKIHRLNDRCLWAGAGELALVQRVEEHLGALPQDASLSNLRDQLGAIIKQCVTELTQLDFRLQFLPPDPDRLLQLHYADFIFAEVARGVAELLHISSLGSPEWFQERPLVVGNGDLFAYALLQKYQGRSLTLAKAAVLAYKVIEEAIEVGAYGLGPPIDVWEVTPAELKQLTAGELAALAAAAHELREQEIQLLIAD